MRRFIKVISLFICMILMLLSVSCSNETVETSVTSNAPESDKVALYSIIAETRTLRDDQAMEYSVGCNYFSAVDDSAIFVEIIDPSGDVVYTCSEVFISGKNYTNTVSPTDCGIELFNGGDYEIRVSNSYNGYVGTAIVHTDVLSDNAIVPSKDDKIGSVDNITYTNEYFGITYECPSKFEADDISYYPPEYYGGYKVDYVAFSYDYSFAVMSMVGHVYYEDEIETKDLINYTQFSKETFEDSEVVTLNGIEFLKLEKNDYLYYMTYKDSEIFVIEIAWSSRNSSYIEDITESIKPID